MQEWGGFLAAFEEACRVHLWFRLLATMTIIAGSSLLFYLADYPPTVWVVLGQAIAQLPALRAAQGAVGVVSVASLIALAVLVVCCWLILVSLGWAVVRCWFGRSSPADVVVQEDTTARSVHNQQGEKQEAPERREEQPAQAEVPLPQDTSAGTTSSGEVQEWWDQVAETSPAQAEPGSIGRAPGMQVAARKLPIPLPHRVGEADLLFSRMEGKKGVFLLADGKGSSQVSGQAVCDLATKPLRDLLLPLIEGKAPWSEHVLKARLIGGIQEANAALYGRNREEHTYMSAMLLAAVVVEANVYIANVGSIRAYVFSEAEDLEQVTPSLTTTKQKGSPLLGEQAAAAIDSFMLQLQAGDMLILGSDGVWVGASQGMIKHLVKYSSQLPSTLADALIERQSEDHKAVIVARL